MARGPLACKLPSTDPRVEELVGLYAEVEEARTRMYIKCLEIMEATTPVKVGDVLDDPWGYTGKFRVQRLDVTFDRVCGPRLWVEMRQIKKDGTDSVNVRRFELGPKLTEWDWGAVREIPWNGRIAI